MISPLTDLQDNFLSKLSLELFAPPLAQTLVFLPGPMSGGGTSMDSRSMVHP